MDIPRFTHLNPSTNTTEKAAGIKSAVQGQVSKGRKAAAVYDSGLESTTPQPSTVAHLIQKQIETHEKKVEEVTGEKPSLKESLLQWRIHF